MKRKIFLALVLVAMVVCALAISVSADTIVPSSSDEFGTLTIFDDAIGNTNISQLKDDGTVARTVLFDGTSYYTVPTSYILTESPKNRGDVKGEMFLLSFGDIGGKLNASFNKNSIIRIEFPSDIAFICANNENLSGCANLLEVYTNDGLRFWENKQVKAFTNCKKLVYADLSGVIMEHPLDTFALFEYCERLEHVKLPNAYFNGEKYIEYETDHMFSGCKALTTIDNLQGFFGNEKTLEFKTFYNCWALTELPLWDGLETLEERATGCCTSITSIIIPDSVKTIGTGSTVFEGCTSLKKIVFPSGAVSVGAYAFEKCTGLTDVWMPGVGSTFGKQVFGQCNSNTAVSFYFTAGENTITISNMDNNKDPFITALTAAGDTRIKYNTPLSTKCEVFLGGHTWKGESNMVIDSYFEEIRFCDSCVDCGKEDLTKTINPIFTWKGYSASTFGEGYSVVQGFYVNQDAINDYLVYAPDFDYGILATVNKTGDAITPKVGDDNVLSGTFVKNANDYLDIKVTGVPVGHEDTLVVFCVYVTVGDKVYYLDGGETRESIVGISYNGILKATK